MTETTATANGATDYGYANEAIDKVATEDRLRACECLHTVMDMLLMEPSSPHRLEVMHTMVEYMGQELASLRACLKLED